MKRIPLMYQSEEQTKDLVLSTRSNKLGEVLCVAEYLNNDGSKDYAFFIIYHLLWISFILISNKLIID